MRVLQPGLIRSISGVLQRSARVGCRGLGRAADMIIDNSINFELCRAVADECTVQTSIQT